MDRIVIKFPGKKIKSLNWWIKGVTAKARKFRHIIAKKERNDMATIIRSSTYSLNGPPYKISIIRISSRQFDYDNFIGGCKNLRDGMADGLGYSSDNHSDLQWEYIQKKGKVAVEIVIESVGNV